MSSKSNSQNSISQSSPLQSSEIILYSSPEGNVRVEVLFHEETFWLTQKQMAEMFEVDVHTIIEHLRNIFKSGELAEEATCRKSPQVQQEGNRQVSRKVNSYSLDIINV